MTDSLALLKVSRYSKMEKADVLEMAVQHLRDLKRMEKSRQGEPRKILENFGQNFVHFLFVPSEC